MGGTLMVSRTVKNHTHYKKRLEELGFKNVTVTARENDGLDFLIRDLQPDLLMMAARFYDGETPYLMGELKKRFPKIPMAALSIERYTEELAMYFIFNGVKSYVTASDGIEQFYEGLEEIRKGKKYISPSVQERIDMRDGAPKPASTITKRRREVMRVKCIGYTDEQAAEALHISPRTVTTHKTEILRSLNARSVGQLIIKALKLNLFTLDELSFCPRDFIVNPLPVKPEKKRRK